MALVESNNFNQGTLAPNFSLLNVLTDNVESLNQLKGEKGTVIMFICNHCPFVLHVNHELVNLANDYLKKGINFIAISSNDVVHYPQDGPNKMKRVAETLNYPFPYLYDDTQEIANAYDAACTPDFYLFDANLKSIYHGQLDDSRPGNGIPVSGNSMREAIDHLLSNKGSITDQKPSIGCSIKWK